MLETIQPVITRIYGETAMSKALAEELARRLAENDWYYHGDESLEDAMRLVIWNYMPGGDTAAYAAAQITEALKEAGR